MHGTTSPGTLARIVVTPNATLFPLSKQQMTAIGYDADDKEVPIEPTWSAAAGATITTSGLLTAGAAVGTGTVTATSGDVSGSATITVAAGPLASLTINPVVPSLVVGSTQQFAVVGKDIGGNVVPVTAAWSVGAGGGSITQAGLFTAGGTAGTFVNTVTATAGGITASATVTVLAGALANITITPNPATVRSGATQQFTATGRDLSGNVVAVNPAWFVTNGGGTITAGGLFTATGAPNTYTNTVSATSGAISGAATVVITAGALATITVTPNPAVMGPNASQQFTAVGKDAAGNVVPVVLTWTTTAASGNASITADGFYTAGPIVGIFSNEVTATSGTVSGTATVIVSGGGIPTNSTFLGNAARFGVLAGLGVNCTTAGVVNGPSADVGSSPTNTITGFPPCVLTGTMTADAAAGQTDLAAAYNLHQAIPNCTDLTGTDLGSFGPLNGLPPGCYKFTAGATLTGTLALNGGASSQWVFQVATTLTVSAGANVILSNAIPDNVRWAVGTNATLGSGSHVQGNIMALNNIVIAANATLNGRALARNGSVDMTSAVVSKP